jgi:17beta-estradiol 17-dehydrogenase / very-long-chain 3-oxoacyl-CoA reductase
MCFPHYPSDDKQIKEFKRGDRPAYAIITGPTSGIGKSFAFAFAKKGFNLILVSRSLQKLQELRSQISEKYGNVDIVLCDIDMASSPLDSKFEKTVKKVAEKGDIRILVNNAGRSHDMPVTFEETSNEEMEGIIGVNIGGVVRATKIVLPFMLNDKFPSLLLANVGKRRNG